MLQSVPIEPINHEQTTPTFTDFWTLYPRKVARRAADRSWGRLESDAKLAAMAGLVVWREVWAWQCTMREDADQYIPYPATWINGWRWEDEVPQQFRARPNGRPLGVPDPAPYVRADPERVRALIAQYRGK